jgi:hypothetical protein
LGDEPAQLHRLADTVEARLRRAQEEIEQATQALKQVQGVLVEQCRATEQENISLQEKFDEEKAQIQQGKEQLLAEQLEVKEAVNRALRSVTVIEIKVEDRVMQASRAAHRSYPTATTMHSRLRAPRSARDSTGCKGSKRSNCSKRS